jgi:hypothetical protein
MLGALAGLYQGGVVVQTQALQGSLLQHRCHDFELACSKHEYMGWGDRCCSGPLRDLAVCR